MQAQNTVQSIERAIDILEALSQHKNGCGVTNISKMTGLNKATVHRILNTLAFKGYVDKDIETDNYKLGMKILSLASSILDRMDIRSIAQPYMRKLAELTHSVVHLCIQDDDKIIYIDKMESENFRGSFKMNSQIGKRVLIHCTASGKVLVSTKDKEEIKSLLGEEPYKRFTENTILTLDRYMEELETVREKGYAIDDVENEEGIRCIAAPIYDRNGNIIAAISVSTLTLYMDLDELEKIKEHMIKTAKDISYELGYINV